MMLNPFESIIDNPYPFMPVSRRRGPLVVDSAVVWSTPSTTYIIVEKHVSLFIIKHRLMISLLSMFNNRNTVTWINFKITLFL